MKLCIFQIRSCPHDSDELLKGEPCRLPLRIAGTQVAANEWPKGTPPLLVALGVDLLGLTQERIPTRRIGWLGVTIITGTLGVDNITQFLR